jgi:hypothetical protein
MIASEFRISAAHKSSLVDWIGIHAAIPLWKLRVRFNELPAAVEADSDTIML